MTLSTEAIDLQLITVLERARTLGFLGPGPLRVHIDHARSFGRALEYLLPDQAGSVLDLGSGNGLPGLPLVMWYPRIYASLLDAGQRRCAFLREAILELELASRADVREGRAEDLGRTAGMRARFDLVVSRSFGPPATTVECGLPFLRPGGALVISEPPQRRPWARIDLSGATITPDSSIAGVVILRLDGELPTTFPRAINQQRRRPLFDL